ncbi:hypothetical protein HG530_002448 [Fusarium avenaceum]|nr:hypothetical protein HG530_002448 [Fusarium avenaceum]
MRQLSLPNTNNLYGQRLNLLSSEAKKIQEIEQTLSIQASVRLHLHSGLCVPGNSQTCLCQHEQVVGTIANSNDLRQINTLLSSNFKKKIPLALLADNNTRNLTRELAIVDDNMVGMSMVNAQLRSKPSCQRLETAREYCCLDSQSLESFGQLWHTLGDVQYRSQILEESSSAVCDFGDSRSQIRRILDMIGQKVDDFLSDESAVHVEHHQSRVAPPYGIPLEDHIHVPLLLESVDHLVLPQVIQAEVIGRWYIGEKSEAHRHLGEEGKKT